GHQARRSVRCEGRIRAPGVLRQGPRVEPRHRAAGPCRGPRAAGAAGVTVPEMFPLSGRELTAAAYVIIQSSRDPRTPSPDPMSTPDLWLMAAWRLVRRGARLRGLLADGRGKQNLTEIASRPEQPFERPFTYESVPTNAALMAYLIAYPCPL